MNFLILGSGLMGKALAFDLVRSPKVTGVTVADIDIAAAHTLAANLDSPLLRTLELDVANHSAVIKAMQSHDCAIGAVSYRFNFDLSTAALEAGIHFCDLGGNDDVVRQQLSLNPQARERNIAIVPNCGLAPGMANVLAAGGAGLFDSVDRIAIRVGGLPQHPRPPLNYQLVFSVEGLVNEYSGKAMVLDDFAVAERDTMTGIESIEFPPPFGALEAFHTSGGASLLPELMKGSVRQLDYKTIRYPGHCERFKTLLDLGFASSEPVSIGSSLMTSREMFYELLKRKLGGSGPDVVLLRVTIEGIRKTARSALHFTLIDYLDKNANITAMMRTTSFPTSIIAQMLVNGTIDQRGVNTPEQCVPLRPFLEELNNRGITIAEAWI